MARLDLIHHTVKDALIKDGWIITADPYIIQYVDVKLFADLAADKIIAAERAEQKIVVEVKSFAQASQIHELQAALGQYEIYRGFIEVIEPERKIYLAISEDVFEQFFSRSAIQFIIKRFQVSLLVVDLDKEEIVKWKD
jgi:hypothetical protein